MRFALTVTGPAYGTQQASSAWQFAQAVLQEGHELACVFFYREGVLNANQLTAPASDEFDLVRGWQSLHDEHGVALHICVAAALRRGVTDEREAQQLALPGHNLQPGFTLSGLGALAEAALTCDRMVLAVRRLSARARPGSRDPVGGGCRMPGAGCPARPSA